MKNLFITLTVISLFIIFGCADYKEEATPLTSSATEASNQQASKNKTETLSQDETIKQDEIHKQQVIEQIKQMTETEKKEHMVPKEVKICMYYSRNLQGNVQEDFSQHTRAVHHLCNNSKYKITINGQEQSQILNLNNKTQRSVKGIKNKDISYLVPATTDTTNPGNRFREDELHSIIDVPGTVYEGLTWDENGLIQLTAECHSATCKHQGEKLALASFIGEVDIEVDGVKVPYYARTRDRLITLENGATFDVKDLDLVEKKPEFDDWCNPYTGDDDPYLVETNKVIEEHRKVAEQAISKMTNEEKLAHISSTKDTEICMAYIYRKTGLAHFCRQANYNVFFNGKQHNTPLNLNNGHKENGTRYVTGIYTGNKYQVPDLSQIAILEDEDNRNLKYTTSRSDVDPKYNISIVDVPGTLYKGLSWNDQGKLEITTTCAQESCAHADTNQAVFSLIGKVDIEYNGVKIPYYVSKQQEKIKPNPGATINLSSMEVVKDKPVFDDWCAFVK